MSTFLSSLSVRHWTRLREIVLFVMVGLLNTGIDFTVLNLLIALTNHHSGWWLIIFNCLSFLVAVINSYIFNGRVTFRDHGSGNLWMFARFVMVNAGGMAINSGIVWLIMPLLDGRLSPIAAVNISKALAVLVSLCWNYIAIRRWVFILQRSMAGSSYHSDQNLAQLYFEQEETMRLQRVPITRQRATNHRPVLRPVILIRETTYDNAEMVTTKG